MNKPYNSHFKEEMIATAVIVGVLFSGFFLVGSRSVLKSTTEPNPSPTTTNVLGSTTYSEQELQKILEELTQMPPSTPSPVTKILPPPSANPIQSIGDNQQLSITPASNSAKLPIPLYPNTVIEQPYGNGGEYDNADYRLSIVNPRLVVSASRVFKVDVVLANKRIITGLKNRLSATIIKEGEVIAESAPFSLSESATAYPGEQISFTASMSLIAGTDVARLKYLPLVEGVVDTLHDL